MLHVLFAVLAVLSAAASFVFEYHQPLLAAGIIFAGVAVLVYPR